MAVGFGVLELLIIAVVGLMLIAVLVAAVMLLASRRNPAPRVPENVGKPPLRESK